MHYVCTLYLTKIIIHFCHLLFLNFFLCTPCAIFKLFELCMCDFPSIKPNLQENVIKICPMVMT